MNVTLPDSAAYARFNTARYLGREVPHMLERFNLDVRHDEDGNSRAAEAWEFFEVDVDENRTVCTVLYTDADCTDVSADIDIRDRRSGEPIDGAGLITLVDPNPQTLTFAIRGAVALAAAGQPIA